jgi:hypothetical protein
MYIYSTPMCWQYIASRCAIISVSVEDLAPITAFATCRVPVVCSLYSCTCATCAHAFGPWTDVDATRTAFALALRSPHTVDAHCCTFRLSDAHVRRFTAVGFTRGSVYFYALLVSAHCAFHTRDFIRVTTTPAPCTTRSAFAYGCVCYYHLQTAVPFRPGGTVLRCYASFWCCVRLLPACHYHHTTF